MSYDFNAHDIFVMAEQIEENGVKFYQDAANSINDPNNKAFLIKLSEMEKEHKKNFSDMKFSLAEIEKTDTIFDPQNEVIKYLKALADIQIFFKKDIDPSSMRSILETAIIAEKDSIVFYMGMQKLVPKNLGQSKLEDIISEEMNHIKLLSKTLLSLKV